MIIRGLVIFLGLTFVAGLEDHNATGAEGYNYRLIWEDNFNFFDSAKWDHEVTASGGGNEEFQVYTPDERNSFVKDGMLHIKPTLLKDNINPKTGQPFGEEFVRSGVLDLWHLYGRCTKDFNWGCYRDNGNVPPIASARVHSKGRFSFRYGKVEIRARMPGGDWHWPAIWFMPAHKVYGEWPRSGEIDLAEVIGNRDLKFYDGTSCGQDKVQSALHWGIDPSENKHDKTTRAIFDHGRTYAQDFHTYVLEWSENGLKFLVDNRGILDVPWPPIDQNHWWNGFYEFGKPWRGSHNPWHGRGKMAPFDQEFYLIFNVAVGGKKFIPDDVVNQGGRFPKPWKNWMTWFDAKNGFMDRRDDWMWTWDSPNDSLKVDYVRVYQRH